MASLSRGRHHLLGGENSDSAIAPVECPATTRLNRALGRSLRRRARGAPAAGSRIAALVLSDVCRHTEDDDLLRDQRRRSSRGEVSYFGLRENTVDVRLQEQDPRAGPSILPREAGPGGNGNEREAAKGGRDASYRGTFSAPASAKQCLRIMLRKVRRVGDLRIGFCINSCRQRTRSCTIGESAAVDEDVPFARRDLPSAPGTVRVSDGSMKATCCVDVPRRWGHRSRRR